MREHVWSNCKNKRISKAVLGERNGTTERTARHFPTSYVLVTRKRRGKANGEYTGDRLSDKLVTKGQSPF